MKKLLLSLAFLPAFALPACAQAPLQLPIKWPVRTNAAAPAGAEIAAQAPRALATLKAYENANPEKGDRVFRIVYWSPNDRQPAPEYRARLSQIMFDIQGWYAREMERNGMGSRTFKLPVEADGKLQVVMAQGDKTRDKYSGDSGQEIRNDSKRALKEIGIDADKETILIFCNLTDWDAEKRMTGGSSPYYAGGSTRQGTAWQSDSPILNLADLADISEENKVGGQYGKTTLARYNSIFIGGIAHELGHAISMPHNTERPDQAGWGKALMGSGNRTYGEELRTVEVGESNGKGSFLPLADALRLASHPSFSGSVKGFNSEANAQFSNVQISTTGKDITYSANVTSDPPTYAVIAYFDPAGGGDYDATTASAIPDKDGNFTLNTTALTANKGGELRVVALQANGVTDWKEYPYQMRADGTVDLTQWGTQQQLTPLTAAIASKDEGTATRMVQRLEADNVPAHVLEIARVQLATLNNADLPTPAQAQGQNLWLSDSKPTSAKVGWLRATYNRLPEEGVNSLLSAGGKFYARGIYAHAPASHVYDLGAAWNKLSGTIGAPDGKGPSVEYVIVGDGNELWRKKIKDDETANFDVDVAGVNQLELRVENGGNGNGNDWAVWLDPQLTR